jgi:hypothetical protein
MPIKALLLFGNDSLSYPRRQGWAGSWLKTTAKPRVGPGMGGGIRIALID